MHERKNLACALDDFTFKKPKAKYLVKYQAGDALFINKAVNQTQAEGTFTFIHIYSVLLLT